MIFLNYSYIHSFLESQIEGVVTFIWQGWEPSLMCLPFFEKAVDLRRMFKRSGQEVKNAQQTNMLLLNDDLGKFLDDMHALAAITLDGPTQSHDAYRKIIGVR